MNQIQIEANAIETEATEQQDLPQPVIVELAAAHLVLVGGGTGLIGLD